MSRPLLEIADLIRTAGAGLIDSGTTVYLKLELFRALPLETG